MRRDQYHRLGRQGGIGLQQFVPAGLLLLFNQVGHLCAIVLGQAPGLPQGNGERMRGVSTCTCQVLAQACGFADAADIGRWAIAPGIVRLGPESCPTLCYQASSLTSEWASLQPHGPDKCSEAECVGVRIREGYTTCPFTKKKGLRSYQWAAAALTRVRASTVPALIPIVVSLNKPEAEGGTTINLFWRLGRDP